MTNTRITKPSNEIAIQTAWPASSSGTTADKSQEKTLPMRSGVDMTGLPITTTPSASLQNSATHIKFSTPATTSKADVTRRETGTQTPHHDVHNHSFGPGYSPVQVYDVTLSLAENAKKQIEFFNAAGVNKFVWAPIPSNIVAGHAHNCCGNELDPENMLLIQGETYYMPDKFRDGAPMTYEAYQKAIQGKQYYVTGVDWQVGKAYNELPEDMKNRIFVAVTGFNPGDRHSIYGILRLLNEYKETFYIFGENTMKKEFVDKQNQDYIVDFGPDAPINDHFRLAARSGRVYLLHCDSSDVEKCIQYDLPGEGEYFEALNDMFQRHPNTKFFWAHMGGSGKFSPPGEHHVQYLREILRNNPNVCIDMSWDVVAKYYSPNPSPSPNANPDSIANFDAAADMLAREKRIQEMADLIREYPNRFLMGSDALISRNAKSISETYALYSNYGRGPGTAGRAGLFDRLPLDVLEKVLRENFETEMEQAVIRSNKYDREVLHDDLARIQQSIQEHGRVPNIWPDENASASAPATSQHTHTIETAAFPPDSPVVEEDQIILQVGDKKIGTLLTSRFVPEETEHRDAQPQNNTDMKITNF